MLTILASTIFWATALITTIIIVRQIALTISFMRSATSRKQVDAVSAPDAGDLPSVSVIVPAHNEEAVIDGCLTALRKTNYPSDKLEIIVVNDRSIDDTANIINRHAAADARIRPVHRQMGVQGGKPAAIKDGLHGSNADVVVFFDADYLPHADLVLKLVTPFKDPCVGATMGRVIPVNTQSNVLTRLLDLERRAGYVVDQHMRQELQLLPQFGGTCGAVRVSALEEVGGWNVVHLTEDTDLTYRLFLAGHKVKYVSDAECYEESPESWEVRFKQVRRWAYGHNECLGTYFFKTLACTHQTPLARLDAAAVLLMYLLPPLSLLSICSAIIVPQTVLTNGVFGVAIASILSFSGYGNISPYFQIAAGCVSDKQQHAFYSAPLVFLSSILSMLAASAGLFQLLRDKMLRTIPVWDKTARFRIVPGE